jgi:tRNA pseudouridine55 synthase
MITRKITSEYNPDFESGELILIDKHLRASSFSIVHKVRKAVNVKKVGHAGTLDPMATGLLILCTGKKTKEISEIQKLDKTYTGVISLGKTTPSFDLETEFDSEIDISNISEKMIFKVQNNFIGTLLQTPPMYSAVKKNGKALYRLARKGLEIERKERVINISSFEITKIELPDIYFKICCSSGTYIRVIANDFGSALGCGAYLKSLRREMIGEFDAAEAMTISEFVEYVNEVYFTV